MELFRLGMPFTSVYKPDTLIEGYASLIWTERYQNLGDFKLQTHLIQETIDLMPENALISHRDTREVMIVESHLIEQDENGDYMLTVTGSSAITIFNDRRLDGIYQKKRLLLGEKTPLEALAAIMYNTIDNASGKDVTRDGDFDYGLLDVIENVAITDSVVGPNPSKRWWVVEGYVYPQLLRIMQFGDIGIRALRPISGETAEVVTIRAFPLVDRGEVIRNDVSNIQALRFDIFQGWDRSEGQSVRPRVTFNYIQGHLDKASYLHSRKGFKTVVYPLSSINVPPIYRSVAGEDYTGFQRRILSFDAGAPEIPAAPEMPAELKQDATVEERQDRADAMDEWIDDYALWKTKRDNIVEQFQEDAIEDARIELKKSRYVSLFSGDISPIVPYKFKTDYDLGDTVTLRGNYGEVNPMIVSEHIRTEDSEGDRGYPTLILPDQET